MSVDEVSGKTGKWSSSELRDAKVRVVFAKIFYSMMGSQKRIGKKLKGEGHLDSNVKVRRCGLGDGPKRCCRGERKRRKATAALSPPCPRTPMPRVWWSVQIKDRLAQSPEGISTGMTFLLILELEEPAIIIIILQGISDKQQAFCNLRHESKLTL